LHLHLFLIQLESQLFWQGAEKVGERRHIIGWAGG
jgi:hypothetical protein